MAHPFQHEIKLLRTDVLVQGARALGRQPPESGAEIAAPGSLQIIRVGDFHQVGEPPREIFRLNQMVTLNSFHGIASASEFDVRRWTSRQSGWAVGRLFLRSIGLRVVRH
jgi:hypothetical protein